MVSQNSSPDPNSSNFHQFIISNRAHFEDHEMNGPHSTNRNMFSQSFGVLPSIESLRQQMSRSVELAHHQVPTMPNGSHHNNFNRVHLTNQFETSKELDHQGQRLSLSLGSHIPSNGLMSTSDQYTQRYLQQQDFMNSNYVMADQVDHIRTLQNQSNCSTSFERESYAALIGSSRYLKPAQSLLEEFVTVGGKEIDLSSDKSIQRLTRNRRQGVGSFLELRSSLCSRTFSSSMEQELQMKITKLIALLDEVESRYEQYYNQMEEVASSFEVIAGLGAAKSYTAMALQAMSRHFCSVRDSIVTQIRAAKRDLFQGSSPRTRTGLSQLSLFDQEPRQNRLQQLGLIQNQRQPWRPIRGLPENSVTILRSWLFEHFLHPYPTDPEKLMLASQTGLSKNQVSNWFINARVRLWKPMIEEIYKEEFGESSLDLDSSSEAMLTTRKDDISDHAGKEGVMRD
ncbi:hypothetical protein MKW94_007700 [Papaver nudicaule]|uniref:Homeobox domain-containing protein n=1 Tax=Papaver nudicaule TaxID=74823 RepID=A0AA41VR13_PAPNU|nr:hypothetical protein [Papaver nudicaule]